jgi:DNA-binding transcriptional LysR family regulator
MESTLEIRQLRAFVALVEQGSVTAAALALGLAQSTVSEALSSLERAVGTAVFLRRRGARDLVLTDAGTALLPHAHSVLAAIDAAHVAVAGASMRVRSHVAIATNESLSTYVLAGPLEVIRRRWPNTTFEVTIMMCTGVRTTVESGECDFGLMLQPAEESSSTSAVDCCVISNDVPLLIFAQPTNPLATGERTPPVQRDSLASSTLYLTDGAGEYHTAVRRFLTHDGLPGPQLQPTGSVESVKRAVAGDCRAIGMLPAYALLDELREGRFVPLTLRPSPPRMRLEAITSKARAQHPATRQLLDSVRSSYDLAGFVWEIDRATDSRLVDSTTHG